MLASTKKTLFTCCRMESSNESTKMNPSVQTPNTELVCIFCIVGLTQKHLWCVLCTQGVKGVGGYMHEYMFYDIKTTWYMYMFISNVTQTNELMQNHCKVIDCCSLSNSTFAIIFQNIYNNTYTSTMNLKEKNYIFTFKRVKPLNSNP